MPRWARARTVSGEHAQGAVASGAVVEDLQVLKDRVGQLDPGLPAVAVQQLDLHPGPERLDHGIVISRGQSNRVIPILRLRSSEARVATLFGRPRSNSPRRCPWR